MTFVTHMKGASERGYLTLPWGQVHYRHAGDPSAPPLVLLHQSPLSSATFEPALAALAARGVYAVAVDTPGFGMSDAAPRQWSIPEYAEAVWQIVDALGLDRVHLLGQHTGAIVAAEAALQRRDRVRGLIHQGIPLYSDAERAEKIASYAPGYTVSPDGEHFKVIWDRVRWLYPTISGESASRQVGEYLAVGEDYAVAYRAVFDHKLDVPALDGIPTLLLHGDQDVLNRMNDVVTAAFPKAPLVTIPGGTDFVPEEQPEAFAAAAAEHVLAHAEAAAPGFKPLYTASVEVTGGRGGSARSLTGKLATPLVRPAERRPEDEGTDPEELFAAGYAACFDSALAVVSRREKADPGPVSVTASVTLGVRRGGAYGLQVVLEVAAPECPQAELERLAALADLTCPYSNAVRGNVTVTIEAHGQGA
ncbi:Ohr subfamily peroxiredoxin [Actinocorallia herbida]|uniref:Ohr subfamily peroxiredoxin n=1 Tax=Actinocorallia herbida TaxID=58109 RepID=A0A3N1D5C6_9ACTN|nr:Ohr family peroxiredoxin [Actinocorallia herbida]ROO88278.1 Ohr subfamily peroxiredoxin [Actinocorallia herbida]